MIRPSFGPSFYSSFGPSINFLFLSFSIVQCNTTGYCIARCTGYLYLLFRLLFPLLFLHLFLEQPRSNPSFCSLTLNSLMLYAC
ncbi:hypothetical protein BD560DRAFT_381833 [Blakeslea trispora]|nr:hypothetical protein BD560DRAFT_381833 [Blakeslea trispora]